MYHKNCYAAVLIGYNLPNMSGLELVRLLGAISLNPAYPSFDNFDGARSAVGNGGSHNDEGLTKNGLCPVVLIGGEARDLTPSDRSLLACHYRDDSEVPFTGADFVGCLVNLFPIIDARN